MTGLESYNSVRKGRQVLEGIFKYFFRLSWSHVVQNPRCTESTLYRIHVVQNPRCTESRVDAAEGYWERD